MRRITRAPAGVFAKTAPFRDYSIHDRKRGCGSFFIPAPVTLSLEIPRAIADKRIQSDSIPYNSVQSLAITPNSVQYRAIPYIEITILS